MSYKESLKILIRRRRRENRRRRKLGVQKLVLRKLGIFGIPDIQFTHNLNNNSKLKIEMNTQCVFIENFL